jgi:hypothetical protein
MSYKSGPSRLFDRCFVILFTYLRFPVIIIDMYEDAIYDDNEG